ncbi:MAG: U32 family peptidase [Tannerella sp.]|jgi:putative protease|nr:U32 family peptidase [Tannerella sp.]
MTVRAIELVSPARDLECGIEAVKHGADAVYIGAPKFSARAAAGNSIDEIRQLCDFAHVFNVRVYAALNTILTDDELIEAERLAWRLYDAGVDALIIQDFGLTQMSLPPLPLHASTQMDNRTPEKVRLLQELGFRQAVLARELSLGEIAEVSAAAPDITLEAFVHGSLCVSYSGRCYLSAAMTGRSANRGECAQCCRLPYTLLDADGKVIIANKHLLSLKDLNRSDALEAMMAAGVSSFKIEGRLKDVSYVKNITAYYRQRLDAVFARNTAYRRSSAGYSSYTFIPAPEKSFNRGFTDYFLQRRADEITSFDTPKSIGEYVGVVEEVRANWASLRGTKQSPDPKPNRSQRPVRFEPRPTKPNRFQKPVRFEQSTPDVVAGDGIVFLNESGELEGFRVNRVEGERIYPYKMPAIKPGTTLYRNHSHAFETLLSKPSAERRLRVKMEFYDTSFGFALAATDETGARAVIAFPLVKEPARTAPGENIRRQLSKLGNTPFETDEIVIRMQQSWFVPSSVLSEMRREVISRLLSLHKIRYCRPIVSYPANPPAYPEKRLDYTANIHNCKAKAFYEKLGAGHTEPSFEQRRPKQAILMVTKHCLKYSFGYCPKHPKNNNPWKEPFRLIYRDKYYTINFDCKNCLMTVSQ